MLDATLLLKCISGCGNTSHPIFNCPHVLKCMSCAINPSHPNVRCPTIVHMHFSLWHYLTTHFPLPPCPQNAFPRLSNPSNPNVRCPTIVKLHFRLWHYLTPHLQLPRCPQMHFLRHQPLTPHYWMPHYCPNAFQAVALPHNPFSTTPMSSKCISSGINPSNPNVRWPTIVKMHSRLWRYLAPHFPMPPCPQMHFLGYQPLKPQC